MPICAKRLGKAIRDSRSTKGLSQATLANRAHTDQSHLSTVEAGKQLPSLNYLMRIADELGCSVSDWIRDAEIQRSYES